jgi:hypothetical protein
LSRSDASALKLVMADGLTIEIRSDVGQRRLERGKGPVAILALCALALGVMPREQATSKEKFSREPKNTSRREPGGHVRTKPFSKPADFLRTFSLSPPGGRFQ